MQQDYVLFFSNFCNYSKEIVGSITRKNIRNAFVFVCVDTVPNIPSFVDRVPIIANKHTKQLYADENIVSVIDSITATLYPPANIEALPSLFGGGGGYQEPEFEALGQSTDGFNMIDMDHFRITCVAEDDALKNKKADSSVLEQYISQRDTDITISMDRPTLR